jgi:hypothetical protein
VRAQNESLRLTSRSDRHALRRSGWPMKPVSYCWVERPLPLPSIARLILMRAPRSSSRSAAKKSNSDSSSGPGGQSARRFRLWSRLPLVHIIRGPRGATRMPSGAGAGRRSASSFSDAVLSPLCGVVSIVSIRPSGPRSQVTDWLQSRASRPRCPKGTNFSLTLTQADVHSQDLLQAGHVDLLGHGLRRLPLLTAFTPATV